MLGCRYISSTVEVIDTWNTENQHSGNIRDNTQTDICVHTAEFTNNRISCRLVGLGKKMGMEERAREDQHDSKCDLKHCGFFFPASVG